MDYTEAETKEALKKQYDGYHFSDALTDIYNPFSIINAFNKNRIDVFIFEFKLDGSAKEALAQIEEKQYALPYLSDKRPLHKIGVNISGESRTVKEWEVIPYQSR